MVHMCTHIVFKERLPFVGLYQPTSHAVLLFSYLFKGTPPMTGGAMPPLGACGLQGDIYVFPPNFLGSHQPKVHIKLKPHAKLLQNH